MDAGRRYGAVDAVGEPGLAAAQRLPVPPGDPRGPAGPPALPVLPRGPKQRAGRRQVGMWAPTNIFIKLRAGIGKNTDWTQ